MMLDGPVLRIVSACALAWFVSQLVKFVFRAFHYRCCDWQVLLFGQGGMPSSHTAFVATLALSVLIEEGVTTVAVIAVAYGITTIRDALGVRYEVGVHARVLNKLTTENTAPKPASGQQLQEFVGHTPVDALAGIFIAAVAVAIVQVTFS